MDAKDIFFAEQLYLDKVINMLIKEGSNLKKGKGPNLSFWVFFEHFMIEFVDKHHMEKEQHILKMLLKKKLKENQIKYIEGMICEHEMSRLFIGRLGEIFNNNFGNNNKTIEGMKRTAVFFKKKYKDPSKAKKVKLYDYIQEYFDDKDRIEFRDMFLKYNEQMDYMGYAKTILKLEKNYSKE